MVAKDEVEQEIPEQVEEEGVRRSTFELELAASIVARIIERNGGAADVFWDEDSFNSSEDETEYLDPEMWHPDHETLPEDAEIEWNLYPCN